MFYILTYNCNITFLNRRNTIYKKTATLQSVACKETLEIYKLDVHKGRVYTETVVYILECIQRHTVMARMVGYVVCLYYG